MKKLPKFAAAAVLTFVLGVAVLASEPLTQTCGNPAPGQIDTPPCTVAQGNNGTLTSIAPGDTHAPALTHQEAITRIAADFLLNFLPLF